MVIEVEDFGGGGFRFNGEPVNGNGEPTSADPEVLNNITPRVSYEYQR